MSINQENRISDLISCGKYQDAFKELEEIKKERSLTEKEKLDKKYISIFIYLDKGEFLKGVEIADHLIKECKEKKLLLMEIDALLGKIENIIHLGLIDKANNLIKLGEDLLENIIEPESKLKKREAYFLHLKARNFFYMRKYDKSIELFKKSYKIRRDIEDKFGMIHTLLNWGKVLIFLGDFNSAKEFFKESLKLAKKYNNQVAIIFNILQLIRIDFFLRNFDTAISKIKIWIKKSRYNKFHNHHAQLLHLYGHCLLEKGELNKALKKVEKSIEIRKKFGFGLFIGGNYYLIGKIYYRMGNLRQSLEYLKKSEEKIDIFLKPAYLSIMGKIYGKIGDYSKAKRNLLIALELLESINVPIYSFWTSVVSIGKIYHYLIDLSVNNNELGNLNHYLNELYEISKKYTDLRQIEQLYRLNKAIILKSSDRLMDKMEAGTIFKGIAEEEIIDHEITIDAMTNLCDVLISELELTGDERIFQEIEELTDKLLYISKNQYLYDVLAETYFFKAKISLLHLDIIKTKKLLEKAQTIAKEHDFILLAKHISDEYDSILTNLNDWDEKIKQNIPLQERIRFKRQEFLFSKMLRYNLEELLVEPDIPIYLSILYPLGGRRLYNKSFQNINPNDRDLIAEFISEINSFGKEAFSHLGSINPIKHGEYLIILRTNNELIYAYVFKGSSYYAIPKLEKFMELISKSGDISKNLYSSIKNYMDIPEKTNQLIEQLITEIF